MKVAILAPRPDYPVGWRWAYDVEAEAVAEAGATVTAQCWSDPFDPDAFDLVLPLVAWGYHQHFDDWMALLDSFERDRVNILNPVPLLRWNSDKSYLAELYERGIPTVPTDIAERLDEEALARARLKFGSEELVVKPLVSASAYKTFRVGPGDPVPGPVSGSRMMVQPWLPSILSAGEWSLIFFAGKFSHCVAKRPRPGEFRVQPEYGGIIVRTDPPEGAIHVATAALSAAPAESLYARVDLVAGNDGGLVVMELEMIEPAFFLDQAPDGKARFSEAVRSALGQSRQ